MTIAAVILAGGKGTRIGGDKPSRILGGLRLLDRAVRHARSQSEIQAVAVRKPEQVRDAGIPVIQDDPAIEGPLGGLVAAMRFARERGAGAVLTIAADMPFLPPDLAERLGDALPLARAAIACSGGHLHPVCGLWQIEALDSVPDYLGSGQRSLRGLAKLVGYMPVEWPGGPADPFFNINSEDDLLEAERRLS